MVDDEGLDPEIAAHYAAVPERERLADAGNLERVRTWELLTRLRGHRRARPLRRPAPQPDAPARVVTTAYVHLPDELAGEVADTGLRLRALLAVEAEPSLLGASPHLLAIAGR